MLVKPVQPVKVTKPNEVSELGKSILVIPSQW